MKEYRFYTCDVFTKNRFSGNQLAVIPEADGLTDKEMQSIAAEFNYSETTFVTPAENPGCSFRLRIFTPRSELPFAGHPVLGTAFILAGEGFLKPEGGSLRTAFELGIGPLSVEIEFADGSPSFMRFTLPEPAVPEKSTLSSGDIASSLNLNEGDIGFKSFAPSSGISGAKMLLVPLKNSNVLKKAKANMEVWSEIISKNGIKGIYIFAEKKDPEVGDGMGSSPEFEGEGEQKKSPAVSLSGTSGDRKPDYSARLFAPDLGIPEDPATGSAAAFLASYLAVNDPEISERKNCTVTRIIEQGVQMNRPSRLEIEIHKTDGSVRIQVGGSAASVLQGRMFV